MIAPYYLNENEQPSGQHEMHTTGCPFPPHPDNRIALGNFENCWEAITAARVVYPYWVIDGCYYCCNACNTG